jgi:hypothetical protein
MAQGTQTAAGPPPTPWSSSQQRRYRFRNLSNKDVKLRFYHTDDSLEWLTLPNGTKTIAAGAEVAYPQSEFTLLRLLTLDEVKVKVSDAIQPTMAAGQLLTIAPDGSVTVGDYTPPVRP